MNKLTKKRGAKVMAEKKYVIDNAELMAEWNGEKNNETDT